VHTHQAAAQGGQLDHGLAMVGASLLDDDHTIYLLLNGRAGGQVAIGGTGAGDDLTLRATSNASPGDIIFQSNGTPNEIARMNEAGASITQQVQTTGSPTAFLVTGAAHTTLTAATEATDVDLDLGRTVQFATGAIALQRAVRIQNPTYAFVGASTITNAATLYIDGAPVAGTNATITNAYGLYVNAAAYINGKLTVTGALDPTDITLSGGGTAHFIEFGGGSTAAVSAAGTGRIRYNQVGNQFEQSLNGAAYTALGGGTSPWQTTANVANLVTSTDTVTIGSASALGKLAVDGDADEIQLLIQGNSTQTSDLVVFEQSDGTDLWTWTNGGDMVMETDADLYPATDNTGELGKAANRWKDVFAANVTQGDSHFRDDKRGIHYTLREYHGMKMLLKDQKSGKVVQLLTREVDPSEWEE
jgi:hypothetical protein